MPASPGIRASAAIEDRLRLLKRQPGGNSDPPVFAFRIPERLVAAGKLMAKVEMPYAAAALADLFEQTE